MRFSILTTLAAVPLLAFAAQDAQQQQHHHHQPQQQQQQQQQEFQETPLIAAAVPENYVVASFPTPTSPAEIENQIVELKPRQNPDLQAVQAASQVPHVTAYWIADHWDSALSSMIWTQVIYTQTFATAPGQWSTAGAGEVGLGTHTGQVGIVKDPTAKGSSSGGAAAVAVMPQGSLMTVALGLAGLAAGMGVVFV